MTDVLARRRASGGARASLGWLETVPGDGGCLDAS
jgi:hypothetical protein